jgi:cell division protein FtsZ
VVVGTVIDPELKDEIRVTVVATGIGQAEAMAAKPKVAVDNTRKADGSVDYKKLERPTAVRNAKAVEPEADTKPVRTAKDLDYLDIPAFLRRQAD